MWTDHRTLRAEDVARLQGVGHLKLWNVRMPEGALRTITSLWLLDLRGGTLADLEIVAGCHSLRGPIVNQVRGLTDVSAMASLRGLEFLHLYGLARLDRLPSLKELTELKRLEVGQLRSLLDSGAIADPPKMEELFLMNKIRLDASTLERLHGHPTLRAFGWWAPDEPIREQRRVTDALCLQPAKPRTAEEWFKERNRIGSGDA